MRRIVSFVTVFAFAMTLCVSLASAGVGQGYNHYFQWLRDADGDGIPNCLDDDWVRPQNGTGYKMKNGFGLMSNRAVLGQSEDGKFYRNRHRHRKNDPESDGDHLRDRIRLRDGSCK